MYQKFFSAKEPTNFFFLNKSEYYEKIFINIKI